MTSIGKHPERTKRCGGRGLVLRLVYTPLLNFILYIACSGKVLGTIQSSRVGSGLKPGSASTTAKVNTDICGVLATSEEEKVVATSMKHYRAKSSAQLPKHMHSYISLLL